MPHPVSRVRHRVGPNVRRRLAALAALLANTAALVALSVLLWRDPLYTLVVFAVAAGFVACSITALLLEGFRRHALALLAVVLLVAEVALQLFWGPRVGAGPLFGPAALALLGAGFVLGRYALRRPPPAPVELSSIIVQEPGRKGVLILNLRSGGGKAEKFDLVTRATELGIDTVVLQPGDDLTDLAEAAVAGGADVLGMAGGDGSLSIVLGVAAAHDVPFVCIPAGTRNHFALDLGLDRNDPGLALAAFVKGEERVVDYATVNGKVFVNNVALGVYAAVVEQDSYRDAKLQTTLDLLPRLAAERGPWFDLAFDVPDHGHQDGTALLLVSNNAYDVTGGGQRDRLDRGTLGIVTINPEKLSDLAAMTVFAAAGRPDAAKSLWIWEADTFRIESPHAEVAAGVDGETMPLTTPIEFRIVPGGARVLVPEGSRVGLNEQRSASRWSGLFEVAFNLPGSGVS
jgi:diacylglycerol kinase family enzyme